MKHLTITLFAALMAFAATAQEVAPPTCTMTMDEVRAKMPSIYGLDDESALDVIREVYYPGMTREALAEKLCVTLKPPAQPITLSAVDRWRYERCITNAAQAPTSHGVNTGRQSCNRQFGQN